MPDDGEQPRRRQADFTTEVTIGELARGMDALERRMREGFLALQRSIDALSYVHVDRYEADQRAAERRISELEERSTWLSRAVAGALIMAVISAAVGLLVARGGV